jgi:hypothetical protein
MDKKFLISGLVTGVAGFFIGWLIWGILLMKFSEANTTFYPGLMKEDMNLFVVFVSTLVWGYFITWVYANFTGEEIVERWCSHRSNNRVVGSRFNGPWLSGLLEPLFAGNADC